MKFSEMKSMGRKYTEKEIIKSTVIILTFLSFFLSLSFMTGSIRLLISAPRIENSLYFLGDKSKLAVNIIFSSLVLLIWGMFFSPAYIGLYKWFTGNAAGNENNINVILSFYTFKKFFKCTLAVFVYFSIKMLFSVFFCAPPVVLILWGINSLFKEEIFTAVALIFFIGAGFLLLIGIFCTLYCCQSVAAFPYVIAEVEDVGIITALKASQKIMQGEFSKFILFKLSFALWIIPCIFILPISFAWSYYRESCAVFMLHAVNSKISYIKS